VLGQSQVVGIVDSRAVKATGDVKSSPVKVARLKVLNVKSQCVFQGLLALLGGAKASGHVFTQNGGHFVTQQGRGRYVIACMLPVSPQGTNLGAVLFLYHELYDQAGVNADP
jgi:hypothetical protein